jgi:hypothetical protein
MGIQAFAADAVKCRYLPVDLKPEATQPGVGGAGRTDSEQHGNHALNCGFISIHTVLTTAGYRAN